MSLRKKSAGNTQAYFQYVLKHNWQHLVFYGILMLLVVVLPTFMITHESVTNSYMSYELRESEGSGLAMMSAVLTFVTSCAVAVFASMSACSYVNSKQAVGCFHSFPLTRTTLYLTESAVRGIYYLVSLAGTAFLTYSIISFNFPIIKEANTFYFQMLLLSVFAFALFYSIGMFASGLAGTGLLRFLMMCLVVALPIALYLLICAAVSEGMQNVDIEQYLDFEFIKWLCPVTFLADIILRLGGEGAPINYALSLVLVLIPAALFFGAGLFLHLKRKSEASGTSIIWKPLFTIIKYVVIFACTLAGELFFSVVTANDEGWLFFGGLVGLILSFMLTNVILYRSVRSLFKGVKGLCVMAIAMVLFSMFTIYDVANMNAHVWSAGNTRSLTLTLDDVTVEYTEDEDLDTIVPLLREFLERQYDFDYQYFNENVGTIIPVDQATAEDVDKYLGVYESYKYYDEYGNYYEYGYDKEYVYYETTTDPTGTASMTANEQTETKDSETTSVTIKDILSRDYSIYHSSHGYGMEWRQVPMFGIPSCKHAGINYTEKTKPLIEYIISTDEYAAAVNSVKDIPSDEIDEVSVRLFGDETYYYTGKYDNVEAKFAEVISKYNFTNEKRMNSPLVGRMNIWSNRDYYNLPVYAEDYEFINLLGKWYDKDFRFKSADDVYDYMAEQADAVFLVEQETGRIVSLDEKDWVGIFRSLPHTEHGSEIPSEIASGNYLAVVIYNYMGEGKCNTYVSPIRSAQEEAAGKLFPLK